MVRMAAVCLAVLMVANAPVLASTEDTVQGERVSIIGAYVADMGNQDFFPCHRNEHWAVSDQSGLSREYASLVTNAGQPFFVEASGYFSADDRSAERTLHITNYTVALAPPMDCFAGR